MVDLTSEMAALWAALGPAPGHRGRVVQIAAAGSGEGVSTVARDYARLAAGQHLLESDGETDTNSGKSVPEYIYYINSLYRGLLRKCAYRA